jgi:hypothetical protein
VPHEEGSRVSLSFGLRSIYILLECYFVTRIPLLQTDLCHESPKKELGKAFTTDYV